MDDCYDDARSEYFAGSMIPSAKHSKESMYFQKDTSIFQELYNASDTEGGNIHAGDAPLTELKSDSGIALIDDKQVEISDENIYEEISTICTDEKTLSSQLPDRSVKYNLPSPGKEKDEIIAEVLTNAREVLPNHEMSPSEMLSISKKMEEEFRSMVVREQQKKKLMLEEHSSNKDVRRSQLTPTASESLLNHSYKHSEATRNISSSSLSESTTPRSRIARPSLSRKFTARSNSIAKETSLMSPTGQRSVLQTKPRSSPTAIRITNNSSSDRTKGRMPNTKNAQSKIGSLQNSRHTPGGGNVKIESKKADYSMVASKVGSKTNLCHTPSGGKVKIESKQLDYCDVPSKCGSMCNAKHTPGGGKVKIKNKKVDYSHVGSKCGSLDNVTHTPGGGKVKLETKKMDYSKVQSKCGSKVNLDHTPQGGMVKIFHAKVDTSRSQSKIGSKDNLAHTPGGGNVKILNRSIDVSRVKSKCGSLHNASYVSGGGNVQIFDELPAFKKNAKSKIGSLENADHMPGGGSVRIYDEKLHFAQSAGPRTNSGFNAFGSPGQTDEGPGHQLKKI